MTATSTIVLTIGAALVLLAVFLSWRAQQQAQCLSNYQDATTNGTTPVACDNKAASNAASYSQMAMFAALFGFIFLIPITYFVMKNEIRDRRQLALA